MSHYNNLAIIDNNFSRSSEGLSSRDVISPLCSSTQRENDAFEHAWTTPYQKPTYNIGNSIVVTIDNAPEWFPGIVHRLNYLLLLAENWDSYGAKKISQVSAIKVLNILTNNVPDLFPCPDLIPSNDGGIQIEWHIRGIDLEIDVPESGLIGVYFMDENNEIPEDDIGCMYVSEKLKMKLKQYINEIQKRINL